MHLSFDSIKLDNEWSSIFMIFVNDEKFYVLHQMHYLSLIYTYRNMVKVFSFILKTNMGDFRTYFDLIQLLERKEIVIIVKGKVFSKVDVLSLEVNV